MLGDLCDNGGDSGLDSPLEAVLIDGNFDPIWMQRGLSVSDWLCLRVKSSFLQGLRSSPRVATVDSRVVASKWLRSFRYNSIHSGGF